MNGRLTAETLAQMLYRWEFGGAPWPEASPAQQAPWLREAAALLASPEFAAHNEAIRREALLAAADAADADLNLAGLTGAWLRHRAEAAS